MARRKTRKVRPKPKARTARQHPTARREPSARSRGQNATARRVSELEAENRRLREEIAALQARLADRPAPALNLAADEGEGPTAER